MENNEKIERFLQRLDELKREELPIRLLLEANLKEQNYLSEQIFMEKNGFFIGDKIEWVRGGKKARGVITSIAHGSCYRVMPINKDGNPSKVEVSIFWYSERKSMRLIERGNQ